MASGLATIGKKRELERIQVKSQKKASGLATIAARANERKNRGGVLGGIGYAGANLGLGLASVGEGVLDIATAAGDLLQGDTDMAKYRFLDNQTSKARQKLERDYNPGMIMRGVGDVASGIGNSLTFMIPYVGPYLAGAGYAGMGVSGAAEKTGDVGLKELGYGAVSGGMEFALDALTGGAGKAAKNIGASITRKLGREAAQAGAKATGKLAGKSFGKSVLVESLKGAGGEALEESLSELIDPQLQKLFGIDEDAETSLKNVAYAGLIGAISGGLMTAGPAAINYKTSASVGKSIRESGETKDFLDYTRRVLDASTRTQERYAEKAEESKTPADAGKLKKTVDFLNLNSTTRKSKRAEKRVENMAETVRRNLDTYEGYLQKADKSPKELEISDAVLGELRGNVFLLENAATIEIYEDTVLELEDDDKQELVDEINTDAKRLGLKRSDYTVEDLNDNVDDILTTVAIKYMMPEKYGINLFEERRDNARANARADAKKTETAENTAQTVQETAQGAQEVKVEQQTAEAAKPVQGRYKGAGAVRIAGGKQVKELGLSDEQYRAYKAAEILAPTTGADIEIHESLEKDGKTANGYYDPATNTIHININAKRGTSGKQIALYTLGHETTHYIREWSPEKYDELASFVMDKLGGDTDSLVSSKADFLRTISDYQNKTDEEIMDLAREDVIADGMELILTDGKVLDELARTDRTLWQKVKAWIENTISKIRKAYADLNQASKTAQTLRETLDTLEEVERLFTEGVKEAGEQARTVREETDNRKYSVDEDSATDTNDGRKDAKSTDVEGSPFDEADSAEGRKKSLEDYNYDLTDPWSIEPLNYVTDRKKFDYLVEEFEEKGYNGRPIVIVGNAALTGSHRILAAREAGIDIPTVDAKVNEENPLFVDLIEARDDEDRLEIAKQLFDEGDMSEEAYRLIEREDDLNYENWRKQPRDQIRYSIDDTPADSADGTDGGSKVKESPLDAAVRRMNEREKTVQEHVMLADALMGAAQSEQEYRAVKNYKAKAEELAEAEERLADLRRKTAKLNKEIALLKERKTDIDKDRPEPEAAEAEEWIDNELNEAQSRKQGYMDEMDEIGEMLAREKKTLLSLSVARPLQSALQEAQKKAAAMERAAERAWERERETKAWARGTVKAAYEKADERVEKYEQKRAEQKKQSEERQEISSRVRTVRRVLGQLNTMLYHPNRQKHVPEGLQGLTEAVLKSADPKKFLDNKKNIREMAELAASIDRLERKTARTAGEQETLDKMKSKYEHLEAETISTYKQAKALLTAFEQYQKDTLGEAGFDKETIDNMADLVEQIKEVPMTEMTLESLKAVETFYTMILHQVNSANQTFATEKALNIDELGQKASQEAQESKTLKFFSPKGREWVGMASVRKFFLQNMKPLTVFEAIGSNQFKELFQRVLDGEKEWARFIESAREKIVTTRKKYGYDKWDLEERIEVKTKSGTVKLNRAEIMELYAGMRREQTLGHLEVGGFQLDKNATEATKVGELSPEILKKRVNNAKNYVMDQLLLAEMSELLTKEQRAYAEDMQQYLTDLGKEGNKVSQKLYGVNLFSEEHYFPITVAQTHLNVQTGRTGDPNIRNKGMTHELAPNAHEPIVIKGFDTAMVNHINDMATYCSFVLPMEDLTRVLNYKPVNYKRDADGNVILDKNGKPEVDDSQESTFEPLRGIIQEKYGNEMNEYIVQLIRDLNGGARRDAAAGIIDKGITQFKRASTMASLSVLIQQPTSIVRAAAYIEPKYLLNTAGINVKNHKELWERVKKYAPVAIIKEMGGYDTGVGARTADYLNAATYEKGEKLHGFLTDSDYRAEVFGFGAAYADELAWIQMFEACVNEQADKLRKSRDSEEVLKAAGERFTEIVRHTQVYDSTLTRSENMRSKDTGMKMATAFMAEPTTVVSMVAEAIIKGERGDTKFLRNTAGAVIGSILLNSLLSSLVYAMRDDDEDKTYEEKYISTLAMEMAEGVNPAEYFPVFRDIMSLVKGYEIERSDMALIGDLINSIRRMSSSTQSVRQKLTNTGSAVAAFFGLPVTNIMRDVKGIQYTFLHQTDTEQFTKTGLSVAMKEQFDTMWNLWNEETTNAYQLYQSAIDHDTKHFARVAARYESTEDVEQALRKALREYDPRINEAAEARLNGELEVYEDLLSQIENEGNFDRNMLIRAVNNQMIYIKDHMEDESVPKADEEEDAPEALYKTSDLNAALERGDGKDYADIYDYLMEIKQEDGKTEAQARSAVKSSITSYWKKRYLEAWEANDTSEIKRIQAILVGTKLYGNRNDVAKMGEGWVKAYAETKLK